MNAKVIVRCWFLSLLIVGCNGQAKPTIVPVQPTIISIPATVTPESTKTAVPLTNNSTPQSMGISTTQETPQSMKSAIFISQAVMHGGLNLSMGSDGKGKGVDSGGRITTCSDLALNLTVYQHFGEIVITDPQNIDTTNVHIGDVVIFTNAIIPDTTAHAAIITKIDNGMIYITGQYGPKLDGTYLIPGYSDLPITEFLSKIFREMHIYYYQG